MMCCSWRCWFSTRIRLPMLSIFAFIFYELMGWKVTRDNMPGPWWKLNFESQLDEGFLSTWRADRVCKIITDETCNATFDALAPARWVTETSALWPGWARCWAASAPSSGCSSSPCPSPSSATASPSSTTGRRDGTRSSLPRRRSWGNKGNKVRTWSKRRTKHSF